MKNFTTGKTNLDKSQKKLFYLLYPFALRICVRYTNISENPDTHLYDGFAHFFSSRQYKGLGTLDQLKDRLRKVLIGICVEKERYSILNSGNISEAAFDLEGEAYVTTVSQSSREIVDIVRKMPFIPRTVYNLCIIDGFSDEQISLVLDIPESSVHSYVSMVRKTLSHEFGKSVFEKSAQGH